MSLKWERVNDIDELKAGDIIRGSSAVSNYNYCYKVDSLKVNNNVYYCNVINYNELFFYDNDSMENITFNKDYNNFYLTKDLLTNGDNSNSWIEKLIIEKENYQDEIDLLIDCIFN